MSVLFIAATYGFIDFVCDYTSQTRVLLLHYDIISVLSQFHISKYIVCHHKYNEVKLSHSNPFDNPSIIHVGIQINNTIAIVGYHAHVGMRKTCVHNIVKVGELLGLNIY